MNSAPWDCHLGLEIWTSPTNLGTLAYAEVRGFRIVAGQPHCDPEQLREFALEFEAYTARLGKQIVYFDIPTAVLNRIDSEKKRGRLHIGDVPIFSLQTWKNRDQFPEGIRAQARRAERHGVEIEHQPLRPTDIREFQKCLVSWLLHKGLPPLRFLTNPFVLEPWPTSGLWVARHQGKVVGFLTLSHSLFPDIPRVDVIVRAPSAPNGCAELLVSTCFQSAARQGFQRITLGLVPLTTRSQVAPNAQPRWFNFVAHSARYHGAPFYSCQGLEKFKAKFKPESWLPLYCLSAGKTFSMREAVAVMRAFTGGSLTRYALNSLFWRIGFRSTAHWPL